MSIIIEAWDGKIIIPKPYFERYLDIGWFFSGLVKFPFNTDNNGDEENNVFTLWESKDAILSLFDSIKFNKLTIHNNISLDYLNQSRYFQQCPNIKFWEQLFFRQEG